MRECKDCGDQFEKKRLKKGRIDQCDECSSNDSTIRAIGYNDGTLNKSQNIAVYRGSSEKVRKTLLGFRMV